MSRQELIKLLEAALLFTSMNYPENAPEFYPWKKQCRETIEKLKLCEGVSDEQS